MDRGSKEPAVSADASSRSTIHDPQSTAAPSWADAISALVAYGVTAGIAGIPIAAARSRGWTAQQVLDLVDACAEKTCDGVRAFGPGLLYRHLQIAGPGQRIEVKPTDAYNRAVRERALRIGRLREAEALRREGEMERKRARERGRGGEGENEARFGEVLDGMTEEELRALADATYGQPFVRDAFRRAARPVNGMFRQQLLAALARSASVGEGHPDPSQPAT